MAQRIKVESDHGSGYTLFWAGREKLFGISFAAKDIMWNGIWSKISGFFWQTVMVACFVCAELEQSVCYRK